MYTVIRFIGFRDSTVRLAIGNRVASQLGINHFVDSMRNSPNAMSFSLSTLSGWNEHVEEIKSKLIGLAQIIEEVHAFAVETRIDTAVEFEDYSNIFALRLYYDECFLELLCRMKIQNAITIYSKEYATNQLAAIEKKKRCEKLREADEEKVTSSKIG